MDLTKYKSKGNVGLANLGNTCFLNSCVQALSHTFELHAILDKKPKIKNIDESVILTEWNELRQLIWSNTNISISPNRFVHHIQRLARIKGKDIFTGWNQNDTAEFLIFMMDCIHTSISRPVQIRISGQSKHNVDSLAVSCYNMLKDTYSKEYSEVMELMYGIYVSEIRSMTGEVQHAVKPENFFVLDLPIPPGNGNLCSLYDCFDEYTKPEILSGENAWFNEKTKSKEDIKKHITFWNFPKVLIITLKRFHGDGIRKIQSPVTFPINNLDLSKYVSGYNPKLYLYDLYAVCNHSGGVQGGHYTAFVKNANGTWVHFNDQLTTPIDPATIVTPMAYCLFYRKKNNVL